MEGVGTAALGSALAFLAVLPAAGISAFLFETRVGVDAAFIPPMMLFCCTQTTLSP